MPKAGEQEEFSTAPVVRTGTRGRERTFVGWEGHGCDVWKVGCAAVKPACIMPTLAIDTRGGYGPPGVG